MAFTVQDDDGSIDYANSLVTVEEFEDYFTDRGIDYTDETDYPDASKEAALVRATDYLNSRYKYQGEKSNYIQGTCFPRYDISDLDGNPVLGIPVEIKMDCYELAAYLLSNALTSLYSNISGTEAGIKSKRVKADVIEKQIEYFGSIDYKSLVVGNAQNALNSGYLVYQPGMYL